MFKVVNLGKTYYLHAKTTDATRAATTEEIKESGKKQSPDQRTTYYFAPQVEANPCDMPIGWQLGGFQKNGKPFLAKAV